MSFEKLGLKAELLSSVKRQGYIVPTPVQAKAIPVILDSRDVLARAQTGTGKTAAFALPMLQLLSRGDNRGGRFPRALVLTPTRELAIQVADSFQVYGRNLRLRSTVVYGGVDINPQKEKLRRGVDILVATPGRLLDHAGQRTVNLSHVEILVLDEADRMLDMGFIHDIKRIIKLLPVKRQNLLFSATYSDEIKRLADGLLKNPEFIEVARRNTAAELVTQVVHYVGKDNKRGLLAHLIKDGDWKQALVFTRTKHGANKLTKQLETDGIKATAIHGNKTQAARTKALDDFKKGRVTALVATDVASRGLDIDALPHVVNYDLPHVPEDYIHRIGRTGRAGTEGIALSLVSKEERYLLRNIEKLLKKSVAVKVVEGFEHADTVATDGIQEKRRFSNRRDFTRRPGNENSNNRKENSRNGNGNGRGGNGEGQSLDGNNSWRRGKRDFSSKKPRTFR
jgi:ATP-dependent RNA helicase RhlE